MKKYFALTCLTMLFYSMAMAQTNVTVDVTSVYSYSNPFTVGQTCNITFTNRIFYPGVWEFICLPFDASEATLDATFGADNYELQQFSELVDDNNFHFLKMETPQLSLKFRITMTNTLSMKTPLISCRKTSENV